MREIGQGLDKSIKRVKTLVGVPLLIKVNEGRNKSSLYRGVIINAFSSVFTVLLDNGEKKTFSYSDVHTRGVLFLKETQQQQEDEG